MNDTSGLSLGTHQGVTVAFNNATGSNSLSVNGTNLSQGTPNPSDVRLNIATGAGTILEGATPTVAGVMTAADKTKLDTLPAGAVALAEVIQDVAGTMLLNGTHTGCTVFYNDNTGTVSILNTAVGAGASITNLALGTATSSTQPITSSTGTGVTLPPATISTAGLMTATDKQAVDALHALGINSAAAFNEAAQDAAALLLTSGTHSGITVVYDDATGRLNLTVSSGGGNVQSNLALGVVTTTTQPITNSDGTGVTLPSATLSAAGLMSAADKAALDAAVVVLSPASFTESVQDAAAAMLVAGTHTGITVAYNDAGNAFNLTSTASVTTNLGIGTVTATSVPLTSSSGTGATLPSVTTVLAGVMPATDKVKLDAIPAYVAPTYALGTATATTYPITWTGSGVTQTATLPAATITDAGLFASADRINLNLVPINGLLSLWSADPTHMGVGAVTYDAGGALTSFNVVWPDGGTGVYTATAVNSAYPTAVDSFTVTYVAPVGSGGTNKTVTQPLVTRDASGRVSNSPARTVV